MSKALKVVSPTEEIIRRIAMDVGKQVVEHIEWAHQDLVKGAKSWESARLSIRNATYNAVMAAVKAADEGRHEQAMAANDKHRRTMRKLRKSAGMVP